MPGAHACMLSYQVQLSTIELEVGGVVELVARPMAGMHACMAARWLPRYGARRQNGSEFFSFTQSRLYLNCNHLLQDTVTRVRITEKPEYSLLTG